MNIILDYISNVYVQVTWAGMIVAGVLIGVYLAAQEEADQARIARLMRQSERLRQIDKIVDEWRHDVR